MPNLLDYERLVRQVADLNVELAMLKGKHSDRTMENNRWDFLEKQPLVGTKAEEYRLRKVIREWEERYDILNELFVRSATEPKILNWHDMVSEKAYRHRVEKERLAKWEYWRVLLVTYYTKIKTIIRRKK